MLYKVSAESELANRESWLLEEICIHAHTSHRVYLKSEKQLILVLYFHYFKEEKTRLRSVE